MSKGNKKTALITGASGGMGYEFARLFAQDGYNLVLVARNEENLKKIAAELEDKYTTYAKLIVKDLSSNSAAAEVFNETESENIRINVLVNNAGFGIYGEFIDNDINNQLNMIQLNVTTLTHLTWLYANDMVKNGGGKILNIASTAAFQAGPLMAVYYATKAFVLSLSEAISNELKSRNVVVSCFCPGPVETGFQKRAAMEHSKLVADKKIMSAETAAAAGYKGLKANKTLVIPGLQNKVLAFGAQIGPREIVTKITRKIQESKTK